MNNILLDTNILIYLLEGNRVVRELLDGKIWYISFINEMELLMKPNITIREQQAIQALLDECFTIELNGMIKNKAILNARNFRLKLADSIVLATAQTNNIPLLTADLEFKKVAKDAHPVFIFEP